MRFVSFDHDPGEQPLGVDICIIGSGAAGITLACELAGESCSVLLVEAGGVAGTADLARDFAGSTCPPHPEPSLFRRFAFGGTTTFWGGRCVPFDPIDFERRDHVPNSGWPISYADVAGYYPRAMSYCDAGEFDFTVGGSLPSPDPTIAGLPQDLVLWNSIERYSLPTDFGRRYRNAVERADNITVLLDARCVALNKSDRRDAIEVAEIAGRSGRRRRATADIFVLAVGGIETPRIMFASDPHGPGLGNRFDVLGRFYTCHVENTCGRLVPNGAAVRFDFEKTRDGVYCRRKFLLSPAAQRAHDLVNMAFRLHFPDYSDATHRSAVLSAIFLAKSTLMREHQDILHDDIDLAGPSSPTEHLRNVAGGLPQIAMFGLKMLVRRAFAHRKLPYTLIADADGSFPLQVNAEQTPLAASRIEPTGDVDGFGVRRVAVAWKVRGEDLEAIHRAFVLLRREINAHTAARLEFDEDALRTRIAGSRPVGGHHIGTARMAATERTGVVDENCAVFGLPNLFIAGSAVFPTSGHANPTLSIVAMAIRLADHLKACRRGPDIRTTQAAAGDCVAP